MGLLSAIDYASQHLLRPGATIVPSTLEVSGHAGPGSRLMTHATRHQPVCCVLKLQAEEIMWVQLWQRFALSQTCAKILSRQPLAPAQELNLGMSTFKH